MTAQILPILSEAEVESTNRNTEQCRSNKRPFHGIGASDVTNFIRQKSRRNNKKNLLDSKKQFSKCMHKKCVHFEVDEKNEIIPHIQNPNEELVITEEEIKAMWWGEEATTHFRHRSWLDSQAYIEADSADSSYTKKFMEALELCSNSAGRLQNIPLVSNTKVRGLEAYIFPETLVTERKRVVRSVLKVQAKIPPSMNPDHRARLLNAASKSLSRPMRRLSRLLAIGDARVVVQLDKKQYHEDDFH